MKESSLDQFKQLLRLIDDGQFIAPKFFVNHFSERLIGLQKLEKEGSIHTIRKRFQHQKDLHDRELRLIQCINRGWSNRMIAEELSISEGTVKNYISEMYKKLNISNRTELKQLLAKVTS
nr:LuxR C-terminal-related transcriptional regulator [Aquibacillus albus]